jgi:tRNA(fMet)-specific endonuclease VapC
MQIAAIALANELCVVTHNLKEFYRVPRLIVEDWAESIA